MNYPFHPASAPSLAAFLAVILTVLILFLRSIWVSAVRQGVAPGPRVGRVALLTALWLGGLAGTVASGFPQSAPWHLPLLAAVIFLGTVACGASPIGGWMLQGSTVAGLVAFQGFRLPLELVLHAWARQGVIPETMTWTGANWDIVTGIVALGLAPFARKSAAAAWIANLVGFALLLNVVRVATLSSPVPFGWTDVTPKLLLLAHLPYALIAPVCVGGALLGHVVLTRALLRRRA